MLQQMAAVDVRRYLPDLTPLRDCYCLRCVMHRECGSIVSLLPKGSFPDRELSWLVSTAWNTGLHHGRLGR